MGNDSLLTAWQGVQQARPVSKGALLKQTVAGMLYKPSKEAPEVPVLLVGSKADKIVAQECFESVAETLGGDLILHETAGQWYSHRCPSVVSRGKYNVDIRKHSSF